MLLSRLTAGLVIAFLLTQLSSLPGWNSSLVKDFFSYQLFTINSVNSTAIFSVAVEARDLGFCHLAAIPGCLPWLSLRNERPISEVYSPMKIKFRQSGGYAGLIVGCEVNTSSLSAEEAAKLSSLVEDSGILQATSKRTPNAADLLNYEFTIETREGMHHVSFDDLSLPESIMPLLEYLQSRAKPLR
jgi:hypothetical protein